MKRIASCLAVGSLGMLPWTSAQLIYLDPSRPINKRVDDLIGKLSPAAKTSLK